ncbi:outer membrane assembly protein AsmA [Entomohabitans teleogrylli]|uniref:outer membrane assembly protein AsmA n=1 Tax=Entomohabitans teleogrylli TaxID=1384589 RepID=UPI00073D9D1A|nr:outer membrane assembly protein AsmA [Entomohabitans teleogrylli]
MKRFLTTLMILLVVLVVGLTALVLLVNPNDFRSYMVRQVEQRSGYQLVLDGPLRWHVWPRLSILSGRMSLTAPGASQPVVSADNMRLDVALWPMLSHQLQVNQVFLKGAVVQLTPASESQTPAGAPVGPANSPPAASDERSGWSFAIKNLQIADSLLVFQRDDDDQVTLRDINLQMEQGEKHRAHIDFSSRINRNQRDLALSFSADLDVSQFPHTLAASLENINYQLQGADLPPQGISGQGAMQALWQQSNKQIALSNIALTANDSAFSGSVSVIQAGDKPQWQINLRSPSLNLDNLLVTGNGPETVNNAVPRAEQGARQPRPVFSGDENWASYNDLRSFDARIALEAQQLRWRGLPFSDVAAQITNQQGMMTIARLEGKLGAGNLSLPGTLDARKGQPKVAVQPRIKNIEIGQVLTAFNYPIALTGNLSLAGDFTGNSFDAGDFRRHWQGEAAVRMENSRMQGMNFQQLIQQAVARSNSSVQAQQNYDNATMLERFSAQAELDNGTLRLKQMAGDSQMISLTGDGTLDLVKEDCDTHFNIQVTGGWRGESKIINTLKNTQVPLRIYGPWQQLRYNLQVDQILRRQLQDEAKRRLREWAERNPQSSKARDLQQLLDKL